MKHFLLQIFLFSIVLVIGFLSVFFLADGHSDSYYLHFTTPLQTSLILGTSKAAQGIQPVKLNKALGRRDIYNYSFTVVHSPFGPEYYESIQNKLNPETENGIFIITIDPYAVSSRNSSPNNIKKFRENKTAVANVEDVNTHPNVKYLWEYYPYPYVYILTKKLDYIDDDLLHDDGWVEININMKPEAINERRIAKIKDYKKKLKLYNFSEIRYSYFEKTIELLQNHGKVFLVRLPVSEPFLELENKVYHSFEDRIRMTENKYGVNYLDFTKFEDEYTYTDGNHLYKTSGAKVSQTIGEWIKTQL